MLEFPSRPHLQHNGITVGAHDSIGDRYPLAWHFPVWQPVALPFCSLLTSRPSRHSVSLCIVSINQVKLSIIDKLRYDCSCSIAKKNIVVDSTCLL